MKKIEIVAIAENVQSVLDALKLKGIEHHSVKDLDAVFRLNVAKPKSTECCGQGKAKSPSLMKKLENYTKTMKAWLKAGRPVVTMDVFAKRCSICSVCNALKDYECTRCGCPMDTKAKMDMKGLCELNKW